MTPIDGTSIVTAAQMRAAEDAIVARGTTVSALMQRAGDAVGEAVRRLAGDDDILIMCGPGNNGGDGYVAASYLARHGARVRVAATGEPRSDAARRARATWPGPVGAVGNAAPAPVLVDALFGTGLTRPVAEAGVLARLVGAARLAVAVDLPSGIATDDGSCLGDIPRYHLTLALGAAKPSHVLQPAAARCGTVRLLSIGVPVASMVRVLGVPRLPVPGPDANKFTRGVVAIIGGPMAGAAHLASVAAIRSGAGYVMLLGDTTPSEPHALVRKPLTDDALADKRIGALLIGSGLGRNDDAHARLAMALATDRPLVIDGDALHLVTPGGIAARTAPTILTPHGGEFAALFGNPTGSKIDKALQAASVAGAVVVYKGADTVIAAPDGNALVAADASDWLSTAGTGDVLAGTIAAQLAAGLSPLDAAAAGVWLHRAAARRLGPAFIADDLAAILTSVRASS